MAALLAASSRAGMPLFAASLALMLLALLAAGAHLSLLVRRSRWLLLTMLIMFGWLTPGTPLPGLPGASQEGLLLAAENLSRLLVAIAIVALILRALPATALVTGLRTLLLPLALLGISRDRIAVRLALTLEEVEAARRESEVPPASLADRLSLPATAFGTSDVLLGMLAVGLLFVAWLA
ncbi:MAG: hypothetical protein Q8J99_21190 [Sulfuritalea sp.]|nr:hypothetical protein [Sulfuritalea sp.]